MMYPRLSRIKTGLCATLLLAALAPLPTYADIASPVTEIGNFGGGQSEAFGVTDSGVVVGDGALTSVVSK